MALVQAEETPGRGRYICVGWFLPKDIFKREYPERCTTAALKKMKWDHDLGHQGKLVPPENRPLPQGAWEIKDVVKRNITKISRLADSRTAVEEGEVDATFQVAVTNAAAARRTPNRAQRPACGSRDDPDQTPPPPYSSLWEDDELAS